MSCSARTKCFRGKWRARLALTSSKGRTDNRYDTCTHRPPHLALTPLTSPRLTLPYCANPQLCMSPIFRFSKSPHNYCIWNCFLFETVSCSPIRLVPPELHQLGSRGRGRAIPAIWASWRASTEWQVGQLIYLYVIQAPFRYRPYLPSNPSTYIPSSCTFPCPILPLG